MITMLINRKKKKKWKEYTTMKRKKILKLERYNDRHSCRPKINYFCVVFIHIPCRSEDRRIIVIKN